MATTAAAAQFGFGTPWAPQLDFFRRKLNLPSERWDDIERGAHDRAFIVAGAAKADLLADLRAAVDSTMASGGGLNEFKQQFKAVVAKNGWTGWTGEGSAAGEAWRAKVIYQTNMATSYAAGRWQQMNEPEFAKLRPFWKYVHADGQLYPRPLHLAWNGITLPKDHAFWKTHFAPNGWGCRCEIHPVAAPAAGAPTEPPAGWDTVDPKTGAPPGIDKGFDYAPGANAATPLQAIIDQKLIKLDAPIGAAMWQALAPAIAQERGDAYRAWLSRIATDDSAKSLTPIVGAIDPADLAWLGGKGLQRPRSAEIAINSGVINGTKAQRHLVDGDALSIQTWENLPELLTEPVAVLYDSQSGGLLYVLPDLGAKRGQIALKFEFGRKDRLNMIVSGYRPLLIDILARQRSGGLQLMRGELP